MIKPEWIVQKGYSIDAQLQLEGLSFEAFDLIKGATDEKTAEKVKGKIISGLAKELRAECLEEHDVDVAKISYGVYCIALGTGFEMNYTLRSSRIVYVGSGAAYSRIKSHLKGKLFEFASILRSIPLRFYICDLSHEQNGKQLQRQLEQSLLAKFGEEVDTDLPLLNSRNASAEYNANLFSKGWDRPIQKEKGRRTTNWLLSAADNEAWKGAL